MTEAATAHQLSKEKSTTFTSFLGLCVCLQYTVFWAAGELGAAAVCYTAGMDESTFEALVHEAIAMIPPRFRDKLENVAFVVEMHHRRAERGERPIRTRGLLLGLYQGVPYGRRGPSYSGVLPDKITIFQDAIETLAGGDPDRVRTVVRETVWHEVGHYFGMDEAEVRRWEVARRKRSRAE